METVYEVEGMTCGGCVSSLERAFESGAPTLKRTVSLDRGGIVVIEGEHDPAMVKEIVEDAGFDLRAAT